MTLDAFIRFVLWMLALSGAGAISYIAAHIYTRYEHHRRMARYQR